MSLWNFIHYNVVGGGDSALYGVESPTFYLRNGLLNLNVALPLALLAPALFFWRSGRKPGRLNRLTCGCCPFHILPSPCDSRQTRPGAGSCPQSSAKRWKQTLCIGSAGTSAQWRLLVALSPVWVWLAAISALPHKEERFLYVVYPLVSHRHAGAPPAGSSRAVRCAQERPHRES